MMYAMSDRTPRTWYGPMPELGTMKVCEFCHMVVTLREAPSGWRYWTADRDPVDGGRHCDGGQGKGSAYNPTPLTLHLPGPATTGERWAWRYTPTGEARLA